jgi:hypothetical protein
MSNIISNHLDQKKGKDELGSNYFYGSLEVSSILIRLSRNRYSNLITVTAYYVCTAYASDTQYILNNEFYNSAMFSL